LLDRIAKVICPPYKAEPPVIELKGLFHQPCYPHGTVGKTVRSGRLIGRVMRAEPDRAVVYEFASGLERTFHNPSPPALPPADPLAEALMAVLTCQALPLISRCVRSSKCKFATARAMLSEEHHGILKKIQMISGVLAQAIPSQLFRDGQHRPVAIGAVFARDMGLEQLYKLLSPDDLVHVRGQLKSELMGGP